MHPINSILVAAALGIAGLTQAHAQYRAGMPQVVAPPTAQQQPAPRPNIAAGFAGAYQKAGRPRILVFWNRELTDSANSRYEDYEKTTVSSQHHRSDSADETITETGKATTSQSDELGTVTTERGTGVRTIDDGGKRVAAKESVDWRLESSFYHPFMAAGVRLVDRNMAIRSIHGGKAEGSWYDAQSLETSALLGKADLLMEIQMTPDDDSPIGSRFRVTIKDVQTGQVRGLLSTRAIPPSDSFTKYVPAAQGFKKVTVSSTPNLEDFAQRLAEETMVQLMQSWGVST
jgi:hypothetical protein